MNYKILIVSGLGTPEIILILISALFFFTFLGGIIFLIHSAMKRQDNRLPPIPPSNVAINFTAPTAVSEDRSGENQLPSEPRTTGSEKIALPQQHEIRYVSISEIMRCEADDNYTNFYLSSGEKILISKSLKEYSDVLVPQGFLRTHQSHLINPSFVKSWLKEDGGVLLMNNGDKIPVSKPNRESVKGLLSQ